MNLAVAIAHFLNCFLYSGPVTNPQGQDEVSLCKLLLFLMFFGPFFSEKLNISVIFNILTAAFLKLNHFSKISPSNPSRTATTRSVTNVGVAPTRCRATTTTSGQRSPPSPCGTSSRPSSSSTSTTTCSPTTSRPPSTLTRCRRSRC